MLQVSTAAYAFETGTNTVTVNSPESGLEPTLAKLTEFTGDISGTLYDGDPDNDAYVSGAPFGPTGEVNEDPQTAPAIPGHDISGVMTTDISFNLPEADLDIIGETNFSFLDGTVNISQFFVQDVETGMSVVGVDNREEEGADVIFTACNADTCVEENAMLPWTTDIKQDVDAPGGDFEGTYEDELGEHH